MLLNSDDVLSRWCQTVPFVMQYPWAGPCCKTFNYQRIALPYLWHSTLEVQNDVVLVSDSRFRPERLVAVWIHCPLLVASCVAAVQQPWKTKTQAVVWCSLDLDVNSHIKAVTKSTFYLYKIPWELKISCSSSALKERKNPHAFIYRNILPSFSEEKKIN